MYVVFAHCSPEGLQRDTSSEPISCTKSRAFRFKWIFIAHTGDLKGETTNCELRKIPDSRQIFGCIAIMT